MKPFRLFILLIAVLYFVPASFAQGTLAKLKFEAAEQFYLNNNYQSCLDKLTELEKEGLKNPKILHLKILAYDKLRWQQSLANKNPDAADYEAKYHQDMKFKEDVLHYLKNYDIEGLEDKYKEVYKVHESRKNLFDQAQRTAWLGSRYFKEKQYGNAMQWYEKSLNLGNSGFEGLSGYDNVWNLAEMYHKGLGTEKNLKEAVKWYVKLTNNTFKQTFMTIEGFNKLSAAPSYYTLGDIYYYGDETIRDYNLGISYYTKSAELGNFAAIRKIAFFYLGDETTGNILPDMNKAFYWFSKLTDSDVLALFHYEGKATEINYAKALSIFQKPSGIERDFNLSLLYFTGKGVEKDEAKAAQLFLDKHLDYFTSNIRGYWPGDFKVSLTRRSSSISKNFPVYVKDALDFINYLETNHEIKW